MTASLHSLLHSLDFDKRLGRRRLPMVAGFALGLLAGLNGGAVAQPGETNRRRHRRQRRKNRRNRTTPGTALYPDLRTALPEDLRFSTVGGDRVLRLTNTVWNDGEGRLELQGNPGPGEDEVVELFQNVYDEPIGGSLTFQRRVDGRIVYHPAHGHYHFADFASYELLVRSESGTYEPIGESTKTSFCITDNVPRDERYPREYVSCERDLQGLTPGWLDTYQYNLPDQWIVIGPDVLADGEYAVRSTADPRGLLDEGGGERELNNAATTYFTVTGGTIVNQRSEP